MQKVIFLVVAIVFGPSQSAEISKLPGIDWELNFKHYSGFFNVSETHRLHYWFVESQDNPSTDPIIFWFNGGPGCSSLDGLLNEMGPYVVNKDGKTMRENLHAWNKFASVLYIEAPAGVGYSYSTDGNTTTNDDQTSLENYIALKMFFTEFSHFRNHSTFIMGESYGGVYVPTLTARIVDGQEEFPINLAGMALGNGYVNAGLNVDTSIRFAYGHGLLDQKTWNTIEEECCNGCADTCDFANLKSSHCTRMIQDVFQFMWFGGLNPYDVYRTCDPNPEVNGNRMFALLKGVANVAVTDDFAEFFVQEAENMFQMSTGDRQILYGDAPCLNDSDVIVYMNRAEVKKALNIPKDLPKWDICSDVVTRTYQKQYGDMKPFFDKILKANVRILLYYGDTDMACNFMMGQIFANNLGLPRQLAKSAWKFNKQIAGFKTLYGRHLRNDVTFITVKGAGHMAPQWRAAQMQYAINQFVINHPI